MTREQKVEVFNKIMGQPVGKDPEQVSLKLRELGIKLIFEELRELADSSGCSQVFDELCLNLKLSDNNTTKVDKVEQLDALCDVQYTLSWAVNVFGHKDHFVKAFDEVCRSNNSKSCKTEEEAEATKEYWTKEENGEEHYIEGYLESELGTEEEESYYVVKRKSDDKVRKSINYSEANFKQFFE